MVGNRQTAEIFNNGEQDILDLEIKIKYKQHNMQIVENTIHQFSEIFEL
jgi:hypothetical protein